jgi:hypothetical protein
LQFNAIHRAIEFYENPPEPAYDEKRLDTGEGEYGKAEQFIQKTSAETDT